MLCAKGATGKEVGPAEEGLHKVGEVYKVQKKGACKKKYLSWH